MKTYQVPRTDLVVSRIAYGCAWLGWSVNPACASTEADEFAKADRIIRTAIEQGITFFDHADTYGGGKSEAVFGEVLKQSPGLRDRIVLQSKCGFRMPERSQRGEPFHLDHSRENIISAAEASLKRLGTDRLDILLLHRPDALVEPQEVAQAFDELHTSGKVRYFGVSNHTVGQIELLKKYVRQPLLVNQIQIGLEYSFFIADGMEAGRDEVTRITQGYTGVAGTLDYCRLHEIQVQAFSPLRANVFGPPKLLGASVDATPELKERTSMLADIARQKNTTPSAIAVAWLLRHPASIVPIIGSTNPEHLIDNCAADGISLSREEWYGLLAAGAGVPSIVFLGGQSKATQPGE